MNPGGSARRESTVIRRTSGCAPAAGREQAAEVIARRPAAARRQKVTGREVRARFRSMRSGGSLWGRKGVSIVRDFANEGVIIRMVTLRFNETCSAVSRSIRGLAAAALMSAAALTLPAAATDAAKPSPAIPASETQGIARVRGSWWMARGIHDNVWKDFDPNILPLLLVERRPGRTPWALVTGVAAAPAGFTLVLEAGPHQPAIYAAQEVSLPPRAPSPVPFNKADAPAFFHRATIPPTPLPAPAPEP